LSSDEKTVISKRPPLAAGAVPFGGSPQAMGDTLVGRRLEHYELNEFVGGGGMGAVFRATDTRLGRTVAVKVLSRDHGDEETIRRFRNEAQSAARLDHPNIARAYYVGEDQGLNFIVFEFIEGTNLRDEVQRRGPLDLERAIYYTMQVAEALAHSSSRDIVHRDIKPSNVLVTSDGQVKLVDMGLARLHQVESSDDDLTASGVTLGTFDYISPEQARDPRIADVRSDIYSLGCTLFYMLTGQPPFPEGTALQKLLQHNSDEPPDVRLFRPELSPRVAQLLTRMLAKRPSQRHQSAPELIADLMGLAEQLGLKGVTDYARLVVIPAAASAWWNKAWQVLAALALLAVGIVMMEAVLSPRRAGGDVPLRAQFKNSKDMPSNQRSELAAGSLTSDADQATGDRAAISSPQFPASVGAEPESSDRLGPGRRESESFTPLASKEETEKAGAGPSSPDSSSRTIGSDAAPAVDAAGPRARRIVVLGDSPSPPEPQTEFLESLAEACARAADVGLTEIELRYTGPQFEQPLEISSPRLTIRAAPGYRPQIVFRPQSTATDRHMIRLGGGTAAHLAFEGIELRLEVPEDLLADGWSLLALGTAQSLDLTECVLTVSDGDMARSSDHDQVSMIAVQRRRPGDAMTMTDPQLAMGQQARVDLQRTIARGAATLVSMTDETPLTIRWNQGLLVTSKHLIETGGSAAEPQYYEQIVLDLDNVTAYCRQGLYYLRRGPGKNHQFRINAYADQCIFVTDPGVPLFEMVGLASPPDTHELQSTGESNRFSPADMPFLFIRATAGAEPQSFKLGRNWSTESRSQAGVPWIRPPPLDRPPHEATRRDYAIDADAALSTAGFDPLLLPEPVAGLP
jgi:eukaryotic-like serine/threonine-protein kinase